jgi:hypothetical protein
MADPNSGGLKGHGYEEDAESGSEGQKNFSLSGRQTPDVGRFEPGALDESLPILLVGLAASRDALLDSCCFCRLAQASSGREDPRPHRSASADTPL